MEPKDCVKSGYRRLVNEICALLVRYAACWVTKQKGADLEPEGSLGPTPELATCSSPEPDQSSPYLSPHFLNIPFNIILSSTTRYSKYSLSLKFSHHPCRHISSPPKSAICPAHLIVCDLITRIIFREQYRSISSSLCSFLHSPITLPS